MLLLTYMGSIYRGLLSAASAPAAAGQCGTLSLLLELNPAER